MGSSMVIICSSRSPVDLVKHGSERGGLTGARRPVKGESAWLCRTIPFTLAAIESVEALDFPRDGTKTRRQHPRLKTFAKTSQVFQAEREVQLQVFFEAGAFARPVKNAIGERFGVRAVSGGMSRAGAAVHTELVARCSW